VLNRQIALLDAPSNLGLMPPKPDVQPGVRHGPGVLRSFGLRDRLRATDAGEVLAPRYGFERDAATGVRNPWEIADYSVALARAVGRQLDAGRFPLVIGGDCSILLGTLLALHRRGRYGLLFLDGHEDLQTPDVSRTGGAAGMDLALAVGIGPKVLTSLGGDGPLVTPEDVMMVGPRDNPAWYTGEDVELARDAMFVRFLADLRREGVSTAASRLANRISGMSGSGVWIHMDVDVLDDAVMPAVDSRQDDGQTYEELSALLRPVLATGRVTGMQVTIYDPDRDPDGVAGAGLVGWLVDVLTR
jgi:arginase